MWAKALYLDTILLFLLCFRSSYQIACRDEKNKNVDWYLIYKLPKVKSEHLGSNLADGTAYAYMTASSTSWKLSTKSITSGSMLEKTMKNFYSKKKGLTYLFYNDDPPKGFSGTAAGHLKGALAFDRKSGFWLVHSIPKFADDCGYEYPDNALTNGQIILCVTFKTDELNEIAHQLLYSHPNIYSYAITDEVKAVLDDEAETLFTDYPSFITKKPLTRTASLRSLGNKAFTSFAKDNQYKDDLYSKIIAPRLKSNLLVETWRRGSGTFLPPSCKTKFSVLDIVSINMTVKSRAKRRNIFFKSTEDHSKWAISEGNKNGNWICVGDLNRMASQAKRGGGALCFVSSPVRKAFHSIVAETDHCPV